MLALISLILVLVGCANWLTIGLLQFDFVAGLFGSQSNIFSRIVYVIIGIGAIVLTVNIIKNKGRIAFNFKKLKLKHQEEPKLAHQESGREFSKEQNESHRDQQRINEHVESEPTMLNSRFNNSKMESSNDNYKQLSERLAERRNYNKNLKDK